MSYLFKNALKKSLLYSLYNEIKTNSNSYYYFLAKSEPWDNEEIIPSVSDTIINEVNTRNNIVFLKKITINDLAFIIPRYDWDYGIVFARYDDNVEHLENQNFYCMTSNNRVYKCIDNNNNGPSLIQPYATSQNIITMSDGYKWKYMYTVPIALVDRFLTNNYIPVINDITSEYYLRGSIYSATVLNYGSGYGKNTQLEVIGNGYQKNNKLRIVNVDIINGGSGYLFTPTISFSLPVDSIPFQTQTEYLIGQFLYSDDRIYEVTKSGISSNFTPSHTCVCTESVNNGTMALSFVGRTVTASNLTLYNYGINLISLSGFIGEVVISNSGYGYDDDNPPNIYFISDDLYNEDIAEAVCISKYGRIASIKIIHSGSGYKGDKTYSAVISEPFSTSEYQNYSSNLTVDVDVKDIVKHNNLYYKALNSGQLSTIPPTHDKGIVLNGDIELEFVGELATGVPNIYYGYGYSDEPVVTIDNPQLYDFNYTVYEEGINVITNQLIKYDDYFYKVVTPTVLPPPPPISNEPPNIPALLYVRTISLYSDGISLISGNVVYTDTTPKRFYTVENDVVINTIPEHIGGTIESLTYIPLELPNIKFNTVKTAARFTPIIENTQIVGAICNDPGIGYTNATITPVKAVGIGSGAQIIPNIVQGSSSTRQEYIELSAIPGTIECMNIIEGGTGYLSPPQVIIQGDGSNCSAVAKLTNGSISEIEITSAGQNYSSATVSFIRDENDDISSSIDAIVIPVISPQDGHSKNAINELYANKLAICSLIFSEKINGFSLNAEYRQFGIIKNPNKFINKIRYDKNVGSCCYTVYCKIQSPIDTNSFVTDINNNEYKILDYTITNIPTVYINLLLHASNNGKLTVGQSLYQNGKTIIIMSIDYPDIDKQSGELLLLDNRSGFIPNNDQTVVLKTIINL